MIEYRCSECKDTGEYRGLNTVEPCQACGGNVTQKTIDRLRKFSERLEACQQFAKREPIEVVFPVNSIHQIFFNPDCSLENSRRSADGLTVDVTIEKHVWQLSGIEQNSIFNYAVYSRLIKNQERFTAVFQHDGHESKQENVLMTACNWKDDGTADFTLEREPDSA